MTRLHQGLAATLALAASLLAHAAEPMKDIDAWNAAKLMGRGFNIGNTFDNTTTWETGWGNPLITKEYVDSLAALGFKTIRLPVAWDTYARDGKIQPDKLARVAEVVDWITAAGMFCVVNIHWDGGWIDSSNKEKFPKTFATFSKEAETKYRAYWTQIATWFADRNEQLIFEALNEETNFEKTGSTKDAYATLTRVNQLFIDTVRKTGGNNAKRLLIVTGYATDITKTTSKDYVLPTDTVPHKLFISVHYYTPWPFAGMTEDASWGKMQPTWGSTNDVAELNRLFDAMQEFCTRNDLPAFIGEFGVTDKKEVPSRVRWMSAVADAALSRKMVPVLWDTGGDVSRRPPHAASDALRQALPAPRRTTGSADKDLARELGAVLAWRLGPEAMEEQCRNSDSGGAAARGKLVKDWRDKNTALITEVDARVAEVVPLVVPASKGRDPVQMVRDQVRAMLTDEVFAGMSPEQAKAACVAESDPKNPRWTRSGLSEVQQSLAALYDWKVSRGAK